MAEQKLKKNKNPYLFTHNGSRVSSDDVNNYLQQFGNFTTKYFRTWAANINFIKEANNKKLDKKELKNAITNVAEKLNHCSCSHKLKKRCKCCVIVADACDKVGSL